MRRDRACRTCDFWDKMYSTDDRDQGHCKRYPPVVTRLKGNLHSADFRHPETSAHHWCGEYKESA